MTDWIKHPNAKALVTESDGAYAEHFWARVLKTDGCWEWQAGCSSGGYGTYAVKRWPHRAHRVSYALTYGPIPPGMLVCHHCDNKRCVRPDHLFLGTTLDNVRDKLAKGRARNLFVESRRLRPTCKHGHEWTEETTYRYVKDGFPMRECKVCRREKNRLYVMRKRAAS